jgi:hypothetical protein
MNEQYCFFELPGTTNRPLRESGLYLLYLMCGGGESVREQKNLVNTVTLRLGSYQEQDETRLAPDTPTVQGQSMIHQCF